MAGLLSAGMLAEALLQQGVLVASFEFYFPSGTRRLAGETASSASLGPFQTRIVSIDPVGRELSDRRGGLVEGDFNLTIDETGDQWFHKILGSREQIGDSVVKLQILSPSVSPSLYWTGRLYGWRQAARDQWTLNLRPPDYPLKQDFMERFSISPILFPHAADDVRGAIAPIVIGRWDSSGMGSRGGALPTLAVKTDANPYQFLGSWGWIGIPRVYVGGSTTPETTGYSIELIEEGGQRWTVVEFTNLPNGAVRIDATGVDSVGDQTGSLVEEYPDVLEWALLNLILSKNLTGRWFTRGSPEVRIDAAAFDAAKASAELSRGAMGQPCRMSAYFNGEITGETFIRDWCQASRFNVAWTVDGRVTLKRNSPLGTGAYPSTLFRYPSDVDRLEVEYSALDVISKATVRYGLQESGGFMDIEEGAEPKVNVNLIGSAESIDLVAGPAFK